MPKPSEPLGDIAAQVLADNPELAARAKQIVGALLSDVERTIRTGDQAQKAPLVRAILPALLRSMQSGEADKDDALKAAFDRVMGAVRGQ